MDKVSAFGERLPPKLKHFQGHSHTMKIKDVEEQVEDGTKGEAENGPFFDEEEELERKLADVPFEELQKAFADGSGTSFIRKHMLEHKSGRANKNRPAELSSKVPIRRFREVIQAPKKVFRDPRFESLSGNFDQEGFRKRYNFLYEVELPAEKEKLKKMLEKTKDQKLAAELQNRISWTDKQMRSGLSSSKKSDSKILAEHKKKEREATKQGKRPFYLKKSEVRERRLIEKYDELKATGKLESFLEKKRRRNASKDHRYIPYRRPTNLSQN